MKQRIVITGMGAVTPVGIGVENYWRNLAAGVCGIGGITRIDVSALPVRRAGEVKEYRPKEHLPTRLVMNLEPFMQYAYISAEEAIRQSGLDTRSPRVGVVMGTALSGLTVIGETHVQQAALDKQAGPKFLLKAMGNIAAAQLAINYGIKGPSMTVTTACSSGGDAVTLAALLLQAGAADAMVVMAGEAALCPALIQSLCKTGALSKTGESRPFDRDRNGFVLGEGGGAMVLEREEFARGRGAAVLAELLGCANNTDAFNPVSPDPQGAGAAACMRLALQNAGLDAEQVDYINAHGTATLAGDVAETCAIRQVFGGRPVPVSSTKGATGHMMGAGGVTEVIACIKAIESGVLPPNLGLSQRDEQCDLNLVTAQNSQRQIQTALSNAMGFGGQNSCVIVGKYPG